MEKFPGNTEERKEGIKVGDTVFLTDSGVRTLLTKGFTFNDFNISDPLEVVEIRDHKEESVYMIKIPRAGDAIVDFERADFDSKFE